METPIETQLSFELQEIYLENKEWIANILFLEDEMRFFQKLLTSKAQYASLEKIENLKLSLRALQERRSHLKNVLDNRQHVLESMLKDKVKTITLAFIEEDTAIVNEIKALLATDKEVRKNLFALIEGLQVVQKNQKYPIL